MNYVKFLMYTILPDSPVCTHTHTPEYLLDPKWHERHPDNQHIQQIEVVPAEGPFVEESSKSCHL